MSRTVYCSGSKVVVSLPMPIFVVVEDVGWWQGQDGSADQQPYRNAFPRRHCLDDYRALARLAKALDMRLALGMVLGEWDRANRLAHIPGATWMGKSWDNGDNQGPWLEEAAAFLRGHQHHLEIACHGLCHEFWQHGRMERSEFHDATGRMRPREIVRSHLQAFVALLGDHGLPASPRLFLPPALHHSFGNGAESMQALLHEFGIRFVVTRLAKARQYAPPRHGTLTWESGVGILERGLSPVPWHHAAATPAWDFANPILPLHWSNLLHPDPARNSEVVDGWAALLVRKAASREYLLARDIAACWSQAAAFHLAKLVASGQGVRLDVGELDQLPWFNGAIVLKIQCPSGLGWQCRGGEIVASQDDGHGLRTVTLRPWPGERYLEVSP